MLSDVQKTIILKAVDIRIKRGEDLKKIIASYNKLTEEEREAILEETRDYQ